MMLFAFALRRRRAFGSRRKDSQGHRGTFPQPSILCIPPLIGAAYGRILLYPCRDAP